MTADGTLMIALLNVHHIRGSGATRGFDVEQAMGSTTRNYGDVLERMLVLDVPNAADTHGSTESPMAES